jgi:hypothetical protein
MPNLEEHIAFKELKAVRCAIKCCASMLMAAQGVAVHGL